ncbi:MAG: methyltransferase domain-containing protein [Firmicutes bacterium]|nr:methyltransferase domain-containing protein [Bacillota bacterium]
MHSLVEYYCQYDEDQRLFRDNAHKIEWLTTIKYLNKYLPACSNVFDCCAGTGRYSFWLAENGFEVTAGDLMQKHIDYMKSDERASLLKDIFLCNALDMSEVKDNSFDVVLCMGAYYHLHEETKRERLVSECLRVLKNNGMLVLSYINRNAVFLNHFKYNPSEAITEDNVIRNGKNGVFYAANFDEIKRLSHKFSIDEIADIGIDGSMYPFIREINSLDDKAFQQYMEYHLLTCEVPSILGNSMHGLYFATKV